VHVLEPQQSSSDQILADTLTTKVRYQPLLRLVPSAKCLLSGVTRITYTHESFTARDP
jgi:hypothetical protein